jgi:hypothetical protein
MSLARARTVADAVLYEGYVLYPYRASAQKNRVRWQFGVLAPRTWSERGGCEHWWMQTECLAEPGEQAGIAGTVRFLQVQARTVERADDPEGHAFSPVPTLEADGQLWTAWEQGVEREVRWAVPLSNVANRCHQAFAPFAFPATREAEAIRTGDGRLVGRIVRQRAAVEGVIRATTEPADGVDGLVLVRVRIENLSPCDATADAREDALPAFLVGTHTLLALSGGGFVSLADPPEWARAAAAACDNVHTWPVLIGSAGERGVILSSPIILPDYPEIAPESPGDLYDATEIDEILTLRTMALTDDEKREARATDARAAAIIDRVDTMPPEILERLHGAIRSLRPVGGHEPTDASAEPPAPWWDPGVDASVSPDTDQIDVRGVAVARGSRVRLRPGVRRADAQDLFLDGRTARVEGVFLDVDERRYLAVTLEDDPAAALHQVHGRYLYFAPDEVEPLEERP